MIGIFCYKITLIIHGSFIRAASNMLICSLLFTLSLCPWIAGAGSPSVTTPKDERKENGICVKVHARAIEFDNAVNVDPAAYPNHKESRKTIYYSVFEEIIFSN